jgi:tRNA nucleotidyltransferase (CCA-adding enzyme)
MDSVKKIIQEEINEIHDSVKEYRRLARVRIGQLRRELRTIHPDLNVEMSSQGSQWVDYWLVDKGNDEILISFSDEYKQYIGAYSEEDFNKMVDFFKKYGQKYIDSGRDTNMLY